MMQSGYATGIAITSDVGTSDTPVAVNTSAMGADLSHADMIADTTAVAANKVILDADLLAAAPTVAADGTTSTHTATTGGTRL